MAEAFLYGHATDRQRTGYQLLASSTADARLCRHVEAQITGWGWTVTDLTIAPGWCWIGSTEGTRLFARGHLVESSTHERTIQVRALLLPSEACRAIHWNPFVLADVLEDDARWHSRRIEPIDVSAVPERSSLPEKGTAPFPAEQRLPWSVFAPDARELCERWLQQLDRTERERFTYLAPAADEQAHRVDLRLVPDRLLSKTPASEALHAPTSNRSSPGRPLTTRPSTMVIMVVLLLAAAAGIAYQQHRYSRQNMELGRAQQALAKYENPETPTAVDAAETIASERTLRSIRSKLHEVFKQVYPEQSEWQEQLPVRAPRTLDDHHQTIQRYLHDLDDDEMPETERLKLALSWWLTMEEDLAIHRSRLRVLKDLKQRDEEVRNHLSEVNEQLESLNRSLHDVGRDDEQMKRLIGQLEEVQRQLTALLETINGKILPADTNGHEEQQ